MLCVLQSVNRTWHDVRTHCTYVHTYLYMNRSSVHRQVYIVMIDILKTEGKQHTVQAIHPDPLEQHYDWTSQFGPMENELHRRTFQ